MSTYCDYLISFLHELDTHLSCRKKIPLFLIGGSAITLLYDEDNRTADLDFLDPPESVLKAGGTASALAKKHHVYVSPVRKLILAYHPTGVPKAATLTSLLKIWMFLFPASKISCWGNWPVLNQRILKTSGHFMKKNCFIPKLYWIV